jgi:hypothetical protein
MKRPDQIVYKMCAVVSVREARCFLVSFLARAIRKVVHLSSLKIKSTSTKRSVLVVTAIHLVRVTL